ncbi:uncharacterized protein BCR38DRAFT_424428 [Pseudomassariella vexata]|uniref:Uncharacterized protein n=1 Tax=Pseudomassariella vexata TaxID=1141098 RepID=A0A1Y2EB75_9PEZI|nr:uncharacterized protein BCR38DRAFT_424428 [Pseudomassariella vexata]ORY68818.1 hypothetical protein BCR38DRAFT_424428 [Pseudomassariella vexata]
MPSSIAISVPGQPQVCIRSAQECLCRSFCLSLTPQSACVSLCSPTCKMGLHVSKTWIEA